MANDSLHLKFTRQQIPDIKRVLSRHADIHYKLAMLSCEMFEVIYRCKRHSPVLEKWRVVARELM